MNHPVRLQSFAEFARVFGGLWRDGTMGHAVRHFFQNGGTDALIVRDGLGNIELIRLRAERQQTQSADGRVYRA